MADIDSKILYTEIDEEVSSVLDRLKLEKEANIEIVFPRRALMLQSLVSLKLLQKQASKIGKTITIVSVDKKGRDLAKSLGIEVRANPTQKTEPKKEQEVSVDKITEEEEQEPKKKILVAKEEKQERKTGSKSINDVVRASRQEGRVTINRINKDIGADFKSSAQHISPSLEVGTLNRKLLMFFTSLSLVMLAVVFMVILPSTTISIKPKSDVITFDANLKVVDAQENIELIESNPNRFLPSYKVRAKSRATETFQSTGVSQNGSNAEGIITIKNDKGSAQTLIRRTRFKSEDGIIFRLMQQAVVPPKGSVEARVVADPLDEAGEVTGSRGNLREGKLTIPGLSQDNQRFVYGEITTPLSGGVSEATKIASQEDLDSGIEKVTMKLTETLIDQLEYEAQQLGKSIDKDLRLVTTSDEYKIVSTSATIEGDVQPGQPTESFTVTVELEIESVAFDEDEFKRILERGVQGRKTPDIRVVRTKYDGVDINVLEFDQEAQEYTIDASIEALVQYDIDGYYKDLIISNIAGKSLDEAIEYLQSQNFLTGKAKIRMWPFWLTKVPSLADNIKVKEIIE